MNRFWEKLVGSVYNVENWDDEKIDSAHAESGGCYKANGPILESVCLL